MAFNYDTLKRITREGVVSDTVSAGDLAANSITSAKLANSSVGSSELANNSVVLSSGDVTGSLPVSRGGTGLTSVGGANQALTINSSNNGLTYANVGMYGMQVFTGSGTWSVPSSTTCEYLLTLACTVCKYSQVVELGTDQVALDLLKYKFPVAAVVAQDTAKVAVQAVIPNEY
jgi:hypothetical protein